MSAITVVMLNYRRPANVPRILEALCHQTVTPTIWLWNNAGRPLADPRVHAEVVSDQNLRCWPRWFFASYAATPRVMMIDDDLIPVDDQFIEMAIAALDREAVPEAIVGAEGVVLGEGETYWPNYPGKIARDAVGQLRGTVHVRKVHEDVRVDIVKGRCMVLRTEALRSLTIAPAYRDTCDDIAVSALFSRGRRRVHLVSAALGAGLADIVDSEPEVALSRQANWRDVRNAAHAHYYADPDRAP